MTGFVKEIRATGNGLLIRISAIAAVGGLLFGYDTGVISGALLYIRDDLHAGTFEQQAIVAVLLLGAMTGALASGYLADRISRKWTKVISGAIYVVAALGCAFSINAGMLIGFRFLLGISVGTASFVSPLYISEVSPPRVRGGLTSFNQMAVVTGILLAYVVNYLFKDFPDQWRWMLGVAAIPGAVLAVGMLTVPHTPRWLSQHGRHDRARSVLEDLRSVGLRNAAMFALGVSLVLLILAIVTTVPEGGGSRDLGKSAPSPAPAPQLPPDEAREAVMARLSTLSLVEPEELEQQVRLTEVSRLNPAVLKQIVEANRG